MNDGGAAREMLHMSGCNIATEQDAIEEHGFVMEGEQEQGVGEERTLRVRNGDK